MRLAWMQRLASGLIGIALTGVVTAQGFPNRPLRIIVPFPPGGTVDIMGRVVAQGMSDELGQQVLVENRAGANGTIGAAFVAKSAPDGYTMLVTASVLLGTPMVTANVPYDPQKDLTPITNLGSVPLLLVVHPSVPANNFGEFIATVRANPGKHAFATSSLGSAGHLASEMVKFTGKLDMLVVGYKGTAPAIVDLVGGQVTSMIDAIPSAYAQVRAGKVRALAVSAPKRLSFLPDLPTVAESGVPGFENFDMVSWYGVWAPPGMPKDLTERLSAAAAKAIRSKLAEERLASQNFQVSGDGPAEFARYIDSETDKYRKLVEGAKIKKE